MRIAQPNAGLMTDYMTARQLTELLQIDRTTVYRMAERGRLPAIKIGGQWRFPRRQIETWLNDRTDAATTQSARAAHVASSQAAPIQASALDLRTALPLPCVQLIQDTFAQLLEIGLVITDLEGAPITRPSNLCGLATFAHKANATFAERQATCFAQMHQLPGGQPVFVADVLGLACARALITVGGENVGMVIAQGIAPEVWPPSPAMVTKLAQELDVAAGELQPRLDQVFVLAGDVFAGAAQEKVLDALQRLADIVAHVLQERQQFRTTLESIAQLARI